MLRNDGQKLTKYELSPATGDVKEVSDEKFEKLFTRIKPTAIQNAPTSLTRAISTAEDPLRRQGNGSRSQPRRRPGSSTRLRS